MGQTFDRTVTHRASNGHAFDQVVHSTGYDEQAFDRVGVHGKAMSRPLTRLVSIVRL